jgi:GTPase SAR1 family protein
MGMGIIGANAALLCYDLTNAASFTEMGHWLLELRATLPEDTILHVVGTKSDIVAEDPSTREVPFERVIAYVAENLFPSTQQQNASGLGGHAPPMNTPAIERSSSSTLPFSGGGNKSKQELLKTDKDNGLLGSPPSNRSSMNFWGQDLGWDCCHEVSASTGEGVEEVFRVITRRLVEQQNSRMALEARLMMELGGRTVGLEERGSFYGEYGGVGDGGYGNGSFRVGVGDKRRSWMGLTQFPGIASGSNEEDVNNAIVRRQKKGCC